MSRHTLIAAAAAVAALALPSSASAGLVTTDYKPLVAAGQTGATRCLVSENIYDRPFSDHWEWHATTECDVAVAMTTEAWWRGGEGGWSPWNQYGGSCTGTRTVCTVGGGDQGEFQGGRVDHHVQVTAPAGQLWVAAPPGCTGLATNRLDCWL